MSFQETIDFDAAFAALTRGDSADAPGHAPMRWQRRLYRCFVEGRLPDALDLPTGLGKTSVMTIWLIARAQAGSTADLPRRLVYVVDRRVVVDQASAEAEKLARKLQDRSDPVLCRLRDRLAIAGDRTLAVSTLRGGRADNRAWAYDPAAPAIIVGTVDMIGSRLLFSGYRLSRWSRSLQAGLLGADSLVVLDEAHLSAPFHAALNRVDELRRQPTPTPIPAMRVLPLSATSDKAARGDVFRLIDEDYHDAIVARRTGRDQPTKRLMFDTLDGGKDGLPDALARRAAAHDGRARAVLVYSHSRGDANTVAKQLGNLLKGGQERAGDIELITGARRGHERDALTRKPTYLAFTYNDDGERALPADGRTRYLVCTAAGEVGPDLDAEAAVIDLVPLERMVQRLGRVNRRGLSAEPAEVTILYSPAALSTAAAEKDEAKQAGAVRLAATKAALDALPPLGGGVDGSPFRIAELLKNLPRDEDDRVLAFSAPLAKVPIEREHVEAWALTSLREHPGRAEVAPFLRGIEDDEPETIVAWRAELPALSLLADKKIEQAMAAAPLRPAEVLEAPPRDVAEILLKRVASLQKAWAKEEVGDEPGEPRVRHLLLLRGGRLVARGRIDPETAMLGGEPLDDRNRLERRLGGMTVLLEPAIGGIDEHGALYDRGPLSAEGAPGISAEPGSALHVEPNLLIRLMPPGGGDAPDVQLLAIGTRLRDGDHERKLPPLSAELAREEKPPGYRLIWSARLPGAAEDPDAEGDTLEYWSPGWGFEGETASARQTQTLWRHHLWAAKEMRRIARLLDLPMMLTLCLIWAIALHDVGKVRERWQRAAGARRGGPPLAKTASRRMGDLDGYRHEFGSLRDVLDRHRDRLERLDPEWRDLVLHLIAAHHGRLRPSIALVDPGALFIEPLAEDAYEAALRYVRLQRSWGAWGLAWLEALLRAADAAASRRLDEQAPAAAVVEPEAGI